MVLRNKRITVPEMRSAFSLAKSLERRERARVGSVDRARRVLADRLRIGVGTFENLVRERVKTVDARIRDRLQALLVKELEAEILRLNHELEMARQIGTPLNSDHAYPVNAHTY